MCYRTSSDEMISNKNICNDGGVFMKKMRNLICSAVFLLASLGVTTSAFAGGVVNTYVHSLPSSGGGGGWSTTQKINSGPYFEGCGRVTYNVSHYVNYGSWTSKDWRWNTSTFNISSLSGKATGGVALTGNYENTAYNKLDYKYSGVQVYAGTTYSYTWNRTMPLGPLNKNAHYDITTKSGFPNPSILCDNTAQVVFDVGGRASIALAPDQVIPDEFTENEKSLSARLGQKYNGESKMLGKNVMVNQFDDVDGNNVLLSQQKDSPISMNNINDGDFVSKNVRGFKYEFGSFNNAEGTLMNVLKFKKNDVYLALVTDLTEKEALKIAEAL